MTSMRRHYVASTSLRRHVPAGNLAPPPWPPQYSKPCPPPPPLNILNLPTPMKNGLDFGDPDPIFKVTRHLIMLESGLSAFYIQKEWMDSGNLHIYIIVTWTRTCKFLLTLPPIFKVVEYLGSENVGKWLDSTLCPDRTDGFRPNLHTYIFS